MLELKKAEYIDGYRIRVQFNDGKIGIVDLSDSLWGPVFEPLKNEGLFNGFTLSPTLHTICWDNDADFAPEYLYKKLIEQTALLGAGRVNF
ncbi:MAG: DUF2442 domain-containing protein [Candidatus Riflebacteria bacterium]|nr:DUF2442 domain-containing protein [Candidatus Riflebacteria bacterium]